MSTDLLRSLLGDPGSDPGCEQCFEALDRYVEALRGGGNVALLFPEVVTHLASCAACREDAEGLLAAVNARDRPQPEPDAPTR